MAYQGYGEGLDRDLITNTTAQFTDDEYMNPDIAVILSLEDEKTRADRIGQRGELDNPDTFESRDAAFQQSVKDGYLAIAHDRNLPIIDANQSPDTIANQIYSLIR